MENETAVNKFNNEVTAYYENKVNAVKQPWTITTISDAVSEIAAAKIPGTKKNSKQYRLIKKYDIMEVGDSKYLVKKRKNHDEAIVQLVARENFFEILSTIHKNIGHGGRDKMIYALKDKYCIPKPVVLIFCKLCNVCNLKKSQQHKNIVVKPILSKDFNVRGQVDLIDFQSTPSGSFKWLLNYQDHATKYCHLRPLQSKRASEVALELLKIFLQFGAPYILQSDNGREFTATVVEEMTNLWPECKIIHGRPRYPQSQGSVERCNQDVENMLRAWMMDNQSTDWGMGCYFVQWQINCSKHRIINRSPYKALFGSEPKLGLSSKNLSNDILQSITTEEDLNELINTEVSDEVDSHGEEDSERDKENTNEDDNNIYDCIKCNSKVSTKESTCDTCVKEKQIQKERVKAFEGQKKAAEKMIQASDKKLVIIEVGSYVLVNIPKVDRGPLDSQNIIGKVVDKKNNVYQIGTRFGIINTWLSRNVLQATEAEFLDEVPSTIITLRETAKRHSQFGGQGYQKCFCKTSCKTNRCACRKNNVLCSSRCHEKTTCNNK